MDKKGYLILEDGSVYEGTSFGKETDVSGEVVFNTGLVGYPESFTDPSYYGQILTLTYPMIGNYGVPKENLESEKIQIRGLIVNSYVSSNSHAQSAHTLGSWLEKSGVPALQNIDTRSLTKKLRESGVMKGVIIFGNPRKIRTSGFFDINTQNIVSEVSCTKPVVYGNGKIRILILDCGVKFNQVRLLLKHDCSLIRVPWNYDPFIKSEYSFDALVISNGPGDPKMAIATIAAVKKAIALSVPILGICLGNQILALSAGANTFKLKYGHRGQNQPVKDEVTGRCYITSQNHGFAVDTNSLPSGWRPWFTNLNDKTNEGIRHEMKPFFSVQFHPEAAPGPEDTEWIFRYFIDRIRK